MQQEILVIMYGITIVASAVLGGYLPQYVRMTHVRVQLILSFVGGLMLGVAVLHLIPHSLVMTDSSEATMRAMLIGLLITFFMMRAFHFHQHGEVEGDAEAEHDRADHHHGEHHHIPASASGKSWLGVALGLAIHTFVDGLALGAVVAEGFSTPHALPGVAVYLAILLHKPLDAISVASLMQARGQSWQSIQAANALIAVTCPIGALCVVSFGFANSGMGLGYLLAASAGVFLCISLSDLLPEVQFHRHDKLQLSMALLMGIALAAGMELLHTH